MTNASLPASLSSVLVVTCPNGITYRLSADLDERVKSVVGMLVVAKSDAAREELANEARAWGVKGVNFIA